MGISSCIYRGSSAEHQGFIKLGLNYGRLRHDWLLALAASKEEAGIQSLALRAWQLAGIHIEAPIFGRHCPSLYCGNPWQAWQEHCVEESGCCSTLSIATFINNSFQ